MFDFSCRLKNISTRLTLHILVNLYSIICGFSFFLFRSLLKLFINQTVSSCKSSVGIPSCIQRMLLHLVFSAYTQHTHTHQVRLLLYSHTRSIYFLYSKHVPFEIIFCIPSETFVFTPGWNPLKGEKLHSMIMNDPNYLYS